MIYDWPNPCVSCRVCRKAFPSLLHLLHHFRLVH